MGNVYIERYKNKEYIVLQDKTPSLVDCNGMTIVCHLHYIDTIHNYCQYLDNVPCEIDFFLTASDSRVCKILHDEYDSKSNVTIIQKENRGRDLSSLLVTCRSFVNKYSYICFIHDKKSSDDYYAEHTESWIRNMWENILASNQFVRNIKKVFDDNPDLGLLIPPEPFSNRYSAWSSNPWGADFDITKKLANKLNLNADIDIEWPPIGLSSVFWARTDALRKLLDYEWTYDDFSEEPMPKDGTISHAIERIFPYIVQDAGYKTKTVISSEFVPELLSFAQYSAFRTSGLLREIGILNTEELEDMDVLKKILMKVKQEKRVIFLYGAGVYGVAAAKLMRMWGFEVEGFVVSNEPVEKWVENLEVFKLECILDKIKESFVIVTTIHAVTQRAIVSTLKESGIERYLVLHGKRGGFDFTLEEA